MANRLFPSQFTFATERMPVNIYLQVSFGASGAPTLQNGSAFVQSITRNSAGDYTILLKDAYNRLLGVDAVFINTAAPAAPSMWVKTNSIQSKSIEVVFNAAGTATDPASGEVVLMTISARNSSVPN